MPDFLTPPDPSGSPLEKLELSRRTPNPRDLGRYLRMEGIDEDTARRMARAVEQWEREKFFDEVEGLQDLQTWANIHTHPGGGSGPPDTSTYTKLLLLGGNGDTESVKHHSWSSGTFSDTPTDCPVAVTGPCSLHLLSDGYHYAFDASGDLYRYDASADTWEQKASLPASRARRASSSFQYRLALTTDGSLLYLVGGMGSDSAVKPWLDIYDPSTDSWSEGSDLPAQRVDHSVAATDTHLYCFGGNTSNTFTGLNSVFVMDLETGVWSDLGAIMPDGRIDMGRALYTPSTERIWMFGGRQGGNLQSQAWAFSPSTETFEVKAALPATRNHLSSAMMSDGIHASNGESSDVHWLYDVDGDAWSTLATTPLLGPSSLAASR